MLDADEDGFISMDELGKSLKHETTFNPFDSDGDGVPDIDDQFPDDPDESKDADGDGIGDNADFAPSVANDVVYGAGGACVHRSDWIVGSTLCSWRWWLTPASNG